MAGNFFDQFDAPAQPAAPEQPQPKNFFDRFDGPDVSQRPGGPLEITIRPTAVEERMRSFAPPSFTEALSGPSQAKASSIAPRAPQAPEGEKRGLGAPFMESLKSAPQDLLQGQMDSEAANLQGAGNIVRDRKGNFVRKPIGEIEHYDFGPVIRGMDGNVIAFNPKTDVMFRDPESGKLLAFERDKELDNPSWFTKIARTVMPGIVSNAPTAVASSNAVPLAVQKGANLGFPVSPQVMQQAERMRDAAAFREVGVDPFWAAFRSKGGARMARTTEEMPVIGGIVKGPKTETEEALRNAQSGVVSSLNAARTDEQAGRLLQQGLDRFRNSRAQDLEPGVLTARGIEPREALPPRPFMTGAAIERAQQAEPIRTQLGGGVAQTSRGVRVPAATRLDEHRIARRTVESMSDAELETLIRAPARATSFASRQEALFEKAWRSIPNRFRIDGRRNSERLNPVNTRAALADIDRQIGSQIGGQGLITGDLADRLRNAQAHFSLGDLRSIRTEIGRALGSLNPQQTSLNSGQLKQLYASVSRDIEVGLQDIANRAYQMTRVSPNRPDYIAPEVARRADQALRDFRVADRYTRLSMARIEKFSRILGADSPEAAMRTLATRMKEGTIDRQLIRAVRDSLRPEEREQLLGYLVSRMGQGRAGGKEAEQIWNLHGFATDWNRNKEAMNVLTEGIDPVVRRQLDALARISNRMKYYETTKNYSGTAYAGIPIVGAIGAISSGGMSAVATMIAQIGGMAAVGKFLTSPAYVDWMVKAARVDQLARVGGYKAVEARIPVLLSQLERIAANDNTLGPVVSEALAVVNKRLLNADNREPENNNKGQ